MKDERTVMLLLRLGLAFAFIYPAVSAVFEPTSWIGFFPDFIREFVGNDTLLLHAFGSTESIIGFWLISGRALFTPSALASLYLIAIIFFNWAAMEIVFRDISILAMALTLAYANRPSFLRQRSAPKEGAGGALV